MAKKKAFISFDFDNDRALKVFIMGQARQADSPIEVVNSSLKDTGPMTDWEGKTRAAIKDSDIVIVMVGHHTHRASGVLKELQIARELKVKFLQVIGYKTGDYKPVPDAGYLYPWSWENLKKLLG